MYTIGCLTSKGQQENSHLNYLKEKEWKIVHIDITKQAPQSYKDLDALLVFEDTVSTTCHWLVSLVQRVSEPIYLLCAAKPVQSNMVYLHLGAEACFTLDVLPEELYLTLNNSLTRQRRIKGLDSKGDLKISNAKAKGLELVARNLSVMINGGQEITLTKKEYQVLEILYMNQGKAITYQEFKKQLWRDIPDSEDQNCRVANIVFHLRNKIEQEASKPKFIKTIRSQGYMLDLS